MGRDVSIPLVPLLYRYFANAAPDSAQGKLFLRKIELSAVNLEEEKHGLEVIVNGM